MIVTSVFIDEVFYLFVTNKQQIFVIKKIIMMRGEYFILENLFSEEEEKSDGN